MRKTSYAITFVALAITVCMHVISARRPEWIILRIPEILGTKITVYYGLMNRCQLQVSSIPSRNGHGTYRDYTCRPFPEEDDCDDGNRGFCTAWLTARYANDIGVGFAALAVIALVLGVTTHPRRTRIWKAVASLITLYAVCQIVVFAIVTDAYRTGAYPSFEQARPGIPYILNPVTWVFALFIAGGVVVTGLSADQGYRWAAGNGHYEPIQG